MTDTPTATPLPQPFEWLGIESHYSIEDVSAVKHRHVHIAHLRALQEVRFFERLYRWTGEGSSQPEPEVLSSTDGIKHRLHGPVIRDGDENIYIIDLGSRIAANREITVHTDQSLLDEANSFQPFFRHLVKHPLQRLQLSVTLPKPLFDSVRPTKRGGWNRSSYSPTDLKTDTDGLTFTILVEKPTEGYEYGIAWL